MSKRYFYFWALTLYALYTENFQCTVLVLYIQNVCVTCTHMCAAFLHFYDYNFRAIQQNINCGSEKPLLVVTELMALLASLKIRVSYSMRHLTVYDTHFPPKQLSTVSLYTTMLFPSLNSFYKYELSFSVEFSDFFLSLS
jgi:hypothetical protein